MTRAALAVALALLACGRDEAAAPDAGMIGPGERCPGGGGCAQGLGCWYMASVKDLACTIECGSVADCAAAGLADACCAAPIGQGVALCTPARYEVCPRRDVAPGADCEPGDACAVGLECVFMASINRFLCSRSCASSDVCEEIVPGGCCRSPGPQAAFCMPAEHCEPRSAPDAGPADGD
jgi:hypothetical protein